MGEGKKSSEWVTEGKKGGKQGRGTQTASRGEEGGKDVEKGAGGRDWHGTQSERGQREGDFESVRQTRETELVR